MHNKCEKYVKKCIKCTISNKYCAFYLLFIKNILDYWKDKFEKLISFLHNKLHSWYDKDDKYIDVVNDMYDDNVLDNDDIEELDLSKEKVKELINKLEQKQITS